MVELLFAGLSALLLGAGVWALLARRRVRRERAAWPPVPAEIVEVRSTQRQWSPVFEYLAPDGTTRTFESSVSRSPAPRVGRRYEARVDPADFDRLEVPGWGRGALLAVVALVTLAGAALFGTLSVLLMVSLGGPFG